jgi:hypothetical protein
MTLQYNAQGYCTGADYDPEYDEWMPHYHISRIAIDALNIDCETTAFVATIYRRNLPRSLMTYDTITRATLRRLQRAQLKLAGLEAK